MAIEHVLILGAGPAGMAAAIALARQSREGGRRLRVTIVELRPRLETIGGTINLTPLAMRYLDALGVGARLRTRCIDLDAGLDYVSMRTGQRLGNIWGGIGAVRVVRHALVESLLQTVTEDCSDAVTVAWGKRVESIAEDAAGITLYFGGGGGGSLAGDILVGCDGLHSVARRLVVQPERTPAFTGRVLAMGWTSHGGGGGGADGARRADMTLPSGEPALRDTLILSSPNGILLASYYEPSRSDIYFANVMFMDEPQGDARDGWRVLGNDRERVRRAVVDAYAAGRVQGVHALLAQCDNWHLYPLYVLPSEGRWHRGRVLLMGDAAHAMPPQGESTGLAIEDGVLLAHVMQRRDSRSVEQLFTDFETLRQPVIQKYWRDAIWAMNNGFAKRSYLMSIVVEWGVWVYLLVKRWTQQSHFAGDVRNLELPD